MSLPHELLQLANHLANLDNEAHCQASRRRAVSTAYYALFHLLVAETTLNWSRPETRAALGRLFEHGKMKSVCDKSVSDLNKVLKKGRPPGPELAISKQLGGIAETFARAYQQRNDADYETSREWSRTDAVKQVDAVSAAFKGWEAIRNEPAAQAFLFSLLAKDR
jgi:uncharacterized protein (UPF0332 family)